MNLLNKGFLANKDEKLKSTTLNPNAAEFVPSALRSFSVSTNNTDVTKIDVSGAAGKAVFNRSESSVSNNSDDEVHQYWRRQLPDDITPDFKVMGDEVQESGTLLLADLSIHDGLEASRFSKLENTTNMRPEASSNGNDPIALSGKMRYSIPTYGEDQSSAALLNFPPSLWDKQFVNGDRHFTNAREGHPYSGDSNSGYFDLLNENTMLDETEINPVEFLATQFPGFAAESLAEVYYASRCDLNLTIDMLIQLEARQAYLIGNKALAKELSVKGQLHNMQMKAAHGKAKESIYRQRNPVGPELQSYGRGQERLIDLHGLHVSEALHILKQELSFLRSTARSTMQPLQVLICVGTGHHTKGSRTPARLPIAVERFLLEEGLEYTESQPGLLRVVLY